MSSKLISPLTYGAVTRGMFNWYVPVVGRDANGNPVALALNSNGSQSAQAPQFSTSSNATPGTADGTVFTLAAGQTGFIQNLDDAALYVKYGASASSSSFTFVLKAGTAANDGLGGARFIDNWIGVVSVAAASGTARYIATKLS